MGSIRRNLPTVRIINLIILIATGSSGGYNRSLEHDVAQAAVLGLKVVNKRTCLTSRVFLFTVICFPDISRSNN